MDQAVSMTENIYQTFKVGPSGFDIFQRTYGTMMENYIVTKVKL